MFGRGQGEPGRRRSRVAIGAVVAVALCLFAVRPVIGDMMNSEPDPAPVVIAATHPATSVQVAGASGLAGTEAITGASGSAKKKSRQKTKVIRTVYRRVTIKSRITNQEILTEEGKGTFVGIKCPSGWKAISGGVLSKYINLLVSSSAPNHPLTRKYTPNIWWLTVVNVNVDGNGGTLPWQGVVNCMAPVKLGSGD